MKYFYLSAFFILLFWAMFVPALEFPDEQSHFASVAFLAETGKMPRGDDIDVSEELAQTETILGTLRDDRGNNRYTYHPENKLAFSPNLYGVQEGEILELNNPTNRSTYQFKEAARYPALYYRLTGLGYRAFYSQSIFDRLFAGRLVSVFLSLMTIAVAYKVGLELFDHDYQAKAVAMLVTLQPMMSFIGSGVNSDVLHNLLFALIVLFSVRIFKYEHVADATLYLLVITVLDFLTKPLATIALPIIFTAFFLRFLTRRQVIKAIALGIAGIYLFFGLGLLIGYDELIMSLRTGKIPLVSNPTHPGAPLFWDYARYSLDRLISQNIVWYWGVFKWFGVVLPKTWWWLANRLVLLSLVGLIIGFYKNFTKSQKTILSFFILASGIYMLTIFWFDWNYIRIRAIQVGVQARYYFPIIVAQLSLLYAGLMGFSAKDNYRLLVTRVLIGFFVGLQLAGIYTIAVSYYDLSSLQTLIVQASQYKPLFAKGVMWLVWGGLYLVGLGNILWQTLKAKE